MHTQGINRRDAAEARKMHGGIDVLPKVQNVARRLKQVRPTVFDVADILLRRKAAISLLNDIVDVLVPAGPVAPCNARG